ncbi:metallophosphoesterase [Paenimyroides aestuarii]|uniref:Metallophosphoesterase n=1 Tax=Paenimyroides aestuarii TaxID=2968490 RepID=A0ABY5NVX3_9FLAO|nr:metallophosphoesterase [Paenimyroides aestuarii]UUV22577.1 metallophosphoesterase [Paenimyroides aestuarii]
MKQLSIKKILKFIFRGILIFIGLIFLLLLIIGFRVEHQDGTYDNWSGLRALFQKDRDFGIFINQQEKYELDGIDGPYLVNSSIYRVDSTNNLIKKTFKNSDSILVQVNNNDLDRFYFTKKDTITRNPFLYETPEKLIAISDVEGNFDGFSSFLQNNQVIDKNFNWIFGNGHLVLVGDFVDRGNNVVPVLWLIYKLEEQAEKQGGKVHYILGNHELLNFQGRYKYNDRKYVKVAKLIYEKENNKNAVSFMYSDKTELGKWLHSKNGIEKIGDYIFVHAGLSPKILDFNLTFSQINEIARNNWDKDLYNKPEKDEKANFLIGREGIFWYRGLAMDYKYYDKITENELDKILSFYQAKKMVFGHSVVDDITKDFNGKIIDIDLKHGKEKNSEKTKGLLIENGIEYKLDGKGKKTKL